MAFRLFPTNADVGTVAANGAVITEQNLAGVLGGMLGHRRSLIVSGMTLSAPGGLVIDIAAGEAVINGYRFATDAVLSYTAGASRTNYALWLRLDRTATLVSGYTLVETSSPGPPDADHLYLGTFSSSGSAVTSVLDAPLGGAAYASGSYTGDDASSRTIPIGFDPVLVLLIKRQATGASTSIFALSAIKPKGVSPSTVAGMISLSFTGSPPTVNLTQDNAARPDPVVGGFHVDGTGVVSTNDLNDEYDWIAFG